MTVAGVQRPRLEDLTGAVPDHGVTVVVGPSGAGKSTLLRLCNRLDVPTSGTVRYRGEDVGSLDPLAHRRRVGMVFQRPTPFTGTVRDNFQIAEAEISDHAAHLALERVGLSGTYLDRDATELSGGEAQRMCLARTLVTHPDVVLMDEPTSSVDPAARQALEGLARALADADTAVLWVTHDLDQMRRIAQHVVVLIDGRIAHAGPADRLETDAPRTVAAFLAGEAA